MVTVMLGTDGLSGSTSIVVVATSLRFQDSVESQVFIGTPDPLIGQNSLNRSLIIGFSRV